MDIAKLRSQTATARASKEEIEDAKFNDSPLRSYINKLIEKASKNGEYEISLNYYYTKQQVFGDKYDGPSIDVAIRHYSHEGFFACEKHWLSPNGYGNTSLIISWK